MEKNWRNFSRGNRLDWQFYRTLVRVRKYPRRYVVKYVVVVFAQTYRCEEIPDRYMAERFFYNQISLALRGKIFGARKIELWQEISNGHGILEKIVSVLKNGRAIETQTRWWDADCLAYSIGVKEPVGEDLPF